MANVPQTSASHATPCGILWRLKYVQSIQIVGNHFNPLVQIDAQLIAKQADAVERTKTSKPSTFFNKSKMHAQEDMPDADDVPDDAEPGEGTLTNARPAKRTKVSAKEALVDIADKPPVDFFGRPIVAKSSGKGKPSSKAQRGAAVVPIAERPYRVSYRYKEGNSAAVRKPVKLASFL